MEHLMEAMEEAPAPEEAEVGEKPLNLSIQRIPYKIIAFSSVRHNSHINIGNSNNALKTAFCKRDR